MDIIGRITTKGGLSRYTMSADVENYENIISFRYKIFVRMIDVMKNV